MEFAFGPEHRLRRCPACDLVFAPAYADSADVYVEGYLLEDGPFGGNFGFDIRHPLFQEFLGFAADRRLATIERVTRPPGRFLDVGCGTGEVLLAAQARGWTAQGVEPVEDSARYAIDERGLDVTVAMLEDSGLPEHSYDVVSAFHVLEHIADGPAFLRMMARWAKPDGHVAIEVPNWRSFHRRGAGAGWPGLRPLEHLAHYTPATLAATMRRAGLEPVKVATPGLLWPKQTLDQMLQDLGAQRAAPWIRRARVLSRSEEVLGHTVTVPNRPCWWALNALQAAYTAARTGLVVLAIARVP